MSETANLKLKKHDNVQTNTNEFDIENYLNSNWDKIDEVYGVQNTEIESIKKENKILKQENIGLKNALPSRTGKWRESNIRK